jgi:hypothetical protein
MFMAVGLSSRDLYQTSIQEDFNLYSSSVSTLKKCYADMNVCKGEWAQTVKDLPNLSAQKKEEIFNTALTKYHTFIKTAEFASKLFERLQANCIRCTRPEISPDTYITMIGLGENAEILRQKAKALSVVRNHLDTLSTRIQTVLKGDIDIRLPQIVVPLENLIGAIRPPLAGWSIGGWRTPALNSAYETWIKNASDEEKNWTTEIDKNILNSTSFGPVEPSFIELNKALQTLNLTYVDPETKISYGVASNQELPKSQEKENASGNELSIQASKRATDSLSTEETFSKDKSSIQSEKNDLSSSSEDISIPSELLFDPSKYETTTSETESESEEITSAPVEKMLENAMLGKIDSQQPPKTAIVEKKMPHSPKVKLSEDIFDVLELATTKVEKEIAKEVLSASEKKPPAAESSSKPAAQEKGSLFVLERKNVPSSSQDKVLTPQQRKRKIRK